MKELNKQVGDTIRRIREEQGLTQEELAEYSGIHEKYVGAIERGLQGITLEYLCRVAKGLNMDIVDIVKIIFKSKDDDEKDKLLQETFFLLQAQPVVNIKLLKNVIAQFCRVRCEDVHVKESKKRIKRKIL